jgi:hypothetical protein
MLRLAWTSARVVSSWFQTTRHVADTIRHFNATLGHRELLKALLTCLKGLSYLRTLLTQVLPGTFCVIHVEGTGPGEQDLDVRIGDVQRHAGVRGLGADLHDPRGSLRVEGDAGCPQLLQRPNLGAVDDGRLPPKSPEPVLDIDAVVVTVRVGDEILHGRARQRLDDRLSQSAALQDSQLHGERPVGGKFCEQGRSGLALEEDGGDGLESRWLAGDQVRHG